MIADAGPLFAQLDHIADSASPILIASDFDGTLTPIVSSPEAAGLPVKTRSLLQRIASSPRCTLMIVSGRSLDDLGSRIDIPAILAGNHGLEIDGAGLKFEHQGAAGLRAEVERTCAALERPLVRWPGTMVERKRLTATVHFRNADQCSRGALLEDLRACLENIPPALTWRYASEAIEILPKVPWGKGSAVNWVREKLGLRLASCVCLGDDVTDESMFRECHPALTIAVGLEGHTAAQFRVADCHAVAGLLVRLAYRLESGSAQGAQPAGCLGPVPAEGWDRRVRPSVEQ